MSKQGSKNRLNYSTPLEVGQVLWARCSEDEKVNHYKIVRGVYILDNGDVAISLIGITTDESRNSDMFRSITPDDFEPDNRPEKMDGYVDLRFYGDYSLKNLVDLSLSLEQDQQFIVKPYRVKSNVLKDIDITLIRFNKVCAESQQEIERIKKIAEDEKWGHVTSGGLLALAGMFLLSCLFGDDNLR